MDNIRNIEQTLFSSVQSEYYKLDNILKKNTNIDKSLVNKINRINNDFLSLELKLKELRLSLLNEKEKELEQGSNILNEDSADLKDIQALEKFKPLIFYYRMMLDN